MKDRTPRTIAIAVVYCLDVSLALANGASFSESYINPQNRHQLVAIFDTASADGEYFLQSRDGGQTWARVLGPTGRVMSRRGAQVFGDFLVSEGPSGLVITWGALD